MFSDTRSMARLLPQQELRNENAKLMDAVSAGETSPSMRVRRWRLLIAATAHANGLDLYSRNTDDFVGLGNLVRVVAV